MSPTLAYVAYTSLEGQRQQHGMLTMHATSAVWPGRGAILLLGDKGSGKTNTLLALARRRCVPAGDDLVVLRRRPGFVEVLPGKRVAAVRQDAPDPGSVYYEHKREVSLDDEGFLGDAAPVVCVARLNVHAAAPQPVLRQVCQLSANERLRLHESLARHISGIPTPLELHDNGSLGPIWPIDTIECSRFRADMTNLFARAPFFYLQARDADEAADLVLEAARR